MSDNIEAKIAAVVAEKVVEIQTAILALQGTESDDVAAHSAGGDTHSTYSVAVCTGTKAV